MSRSRAYSLTWNNYPEDWQQFAERMFTELKCKYLIFGEEIAPTTNTPHLQGHIDMANARTIKALQKKLAKLEIKLAVRTYQSIQHVNNGRTYCEKEGKFQTWGEPPSQGKRSDIKRFVEAVKAAPGMKKLQIMEEHTEVYAKYPRFCNEYKLMVANPQTLTHDNDNWPNVWIWGPPGTGKSRPFHEGGDLYTKMPNKWWTGFDGESTVLLDDLEPQHERMGHYIKIWSDRYPFMACVHHSVVKIRPARLVITSNFQPHRS